MSIKFSCDECGLKYKLRDDLGGKRVKCKCGHRMTVPQAPDPGFRAAHGSPLNDDLPMSTGSLFDEEFPLANSGPSSAHSDSSKSPDSGGAPRVSDASKPLQYPVHEYLEAAIEKQKEKEAEKLESTSLPMLVGIFEFPWHIRTLGTWIPLSMMLMFASGLQALLFTIGVQAGLIGVRTIGVSAFIATVMALAYAAACCLAVIEQTADGNVHVDDWPGALQWKEWGFGLVFMLAMWLEAMLAAFVPTCWLALWTWIPTIVLAIALFPVVLLASSEAGTWAPVSKVVFRSFGRNPVLWIVFYVEYFAVLVAGAVLAMIAMILFQWWSLVVTSPILAAVMLIEARLLGRVAWCIGQSQ